MFNNVMSLSVKISIFLIIKYNYNFMQNKKKTEANKGQKKGFECTWSWMGKSFKSISI